MEPDADDRQECITVTSPGKIVKLHSTGFTRSIFRNQKSCFVISHAKFLSRLYMQEILGTHPGRLWSNISMFIHAFLLGVAAS